MSAAAPPRRGQSTTAPAARAPLSSHDAGDNTRAAAPRAFVRVEVACAADRGEIGEGVWAEQLAVMFKVWAKRAGFAEEEPRLSTEHSRIRGAQGPLFG